MADQLIPKPDGTFAERARTFVRVIRSDPQRLSLPIEDVDRLDGAVTAFRGALAVAMSPSTRTKLTVMTKNQLRRQAEIEVRRCRRIISANDRISATDKHRVFIKAQPERPMKERCPQSPPGLCFRAVENASGVNSAVHVLGFWHQRSDGSRARWAPGAVRIELFVDLVRPGDPIPQHPGQYLDGRPWYLRSFTRSPIKVNPPFAPEPRLVVYWARWADSAGNVGPWSQTVQTRPEGWSAETATPALREPSQHALPEDQPKLIAMAMQWCERSVEEGQMMGLLTDARRAVDEMRQLTGPADEPPEAGQADAA